MDVNTTSRVLLRSSKPCLHANIDCTALVAAIISRQVSVVDLLLQVNFLTRVSKFNVSQFICLRSQKVMSFMMMPLWHLSEYSHGSWLYSFLKFYNVEHCLHIKRLLQQPKGQNSSESFPINLFL